MIRKAELKDKEEIIGLLNQVLDIHHNVRPDLFKKNARKYTGEQLTDILNNPEKPVFVYETDNKVAGYAFCISQRHINDNILTDIKTLYIDDLCVSKEYRGKGIGKELYYYVLDYARKNDFYNLTLNVWYDNTSALKFYENLGLNIQKIGMEKILK